MKYFITVAFMLAASTFLAPSSLLAQGVYDPSLDCELYPNQGGGWQCAPNSGTGGGGGYALTSQDGWEQASQKIVRIFSDIIIPILLGLALVFFLWNVFRFAIAQNSEEARKKAKSQMIWGIGAFVFIVSIWGIINLLTSSVGLGGESAPCSDFFGC